MDEPHLLLLSVYDLHLYAVRHVSQTRGARPRSLVWVSPRRMGSEAHRAIPLGHLWSRRVRVLENAFLDVAVGGHLRAAGRNQHARVERAAGHVSRRSR